MPKIHYRLEGQTPVEEPDVLKWIRWYESTNRTLAWAMFSGWEVSTIFTGINVAGLDDDREPLGLFETMIFDCEPWPTLKYRREAVYQRRYATYAEAIAGHMELCYHAARAQRTLLSRDEDSSTCSDAPCSSPFG